MEGSRASTTLPGPAPVAAPDSSSRPAAQACRIAILYALLGSGWIVGTDFIVAAVGEDAVGWFATVKGLGYVAITALALFYLVWTVLSRERSLSDTLRRQAMEAQAARAEAQKDRAFIDAVLDSIEERIFVFTADGHLRRANAAGWRITGRSPRAGGPFSLEEAGWPAQTRDGVRRDVARVIETEMPHGGRLSYAVGGRDITIEYMNRPFVDPVSGRREVLRISRDVTESVAATAAIARTNRMLTALVSGLIAMQGERDRVALASAVTRALTEEAGFALASICELDDENPQTLRLLAASGPLAERLPRMIEVIRSRTDIEGPTISAIRSHQPSLWNSFATSPELAWAREALGQHDLRSAAVVPMIFSGRLFGVLAVYGNEAMTFTAEDLEPLVAFANQLGQALTTLDSFVRYEESEAGRHAALSRVKDALIETVGALAAVVDQRDPYTAGHQRKVATLAVAIAEELGWPAARVEGVRIGALLHDIGKIAIPGELLTKPGRLVPEEFALIKTHAARGGEMLRGVSFDWPIFEMVTQHHERLDGSGYPAGLTGEAIAEEAKVLAVADVVEAMLAYRPYRPAIELEVVLAELTRGRGRLYDAAVVDAALRLIRERGTAWFQEQQA